MSEQPVWELVANLGDVDFLDYGGYFVFRDTTGVYSAEAEYLELDDETSDTSTYTVYRFSLDRCTLTDGILSDNPFHPLHSAWFAKPENEKTDRPQDTTYLSNVCAYVGLTVDELRAMLCSPNELDRAHAYREIALYHGWENFDSYPLTGLTREEVAARYGATDHCPTCDDEMDTDCHGEPRCPTCDEPCPYCSDQ